jgi:leucyl aminopeptidase
MIELTDFLPLATTQSVRTPTHSSLDGCDHFLVVVTKGARSKALVKLPHGKQLADLLARAAKRGDDFAHSRAANARSTGLTVASFSSSSAFAALAWAGKIMRECLRDKPGALGIAFVDLDAAMEQRAADSLVAAAHAAAFALPAFKSPSDRAGTRLKTLRLHVKHARIDLATAGAQALGNNLARWFTALPPNVLTAAAYRDAIERLATPRGIRCRFLDEAQLTKLGAGAFLAVARGNATRDAGILHLRYRPKRNSGPALALVGKGVLFDTGGTNLKSFHGMLDMHTDMQGSAVALGTLLALAEMRVPYGIDAWLAITENRTAANAYTSQDLVRAVNGTTIQVIHTDAEGRMVLADTLARRARKARTHRRLRDTHGHLRHGRDGTLLGHFLQPRRGQSAARGCRSRQRRARLAVPDGRGLRRAPQKRRGRRQTVHGGDGRRSYRRSALPEPLRAAGHSVDSRRLERGPAQRRPRAHTHRDYRLRRAFHDRAAATTGCGPRRPRQRLSA